MVDFSVELITRGEKSLKAALDSISSQTYNSMEVVCANSSDDLAVEKLLSEYAIRQEKVGPVKHLLGRSLAHSLASGKYSLIMDSTRTLMPEALETLSQYMEKYDMVAIREGSRGTGFWIRQAERYRNSSERNIDESSILSGVASFVLPRLYKKDLLDTVFNSLRRNIPQEVFNLIGYGEHHLIFQEAILRGASFHHYRDQNLIYHYEDNTLQSIYGKYRSYGSDQKLLVNLTNYRASELLSHRRKLRLNQIKDNLICLPIISARMVSFILGMIT